MPLVVTVLKVVKRSDFLAFAQTGVINLEHLTSYSVQAIAPIEQFLFAKYFVPKNTFLGDTQAQSVPDENPFTLSSDSLRHIGRERKAVNIDKRVLE